MRWVTRPWRHAFDFKGRATRREYWLFVLQMYALIFGLLFGATLFQDSATVAPIVFTLAGIPSLFIFIALLSAGVRRLHDHDKSGWMILIAAFPAVGWIFYLIMMLTPPTPGENGYGRDPREGDHDTPDALAGVFS
jgi:uncharacterized membrane protein YhaH (DUF805 family)